MLTVERKFRQIIPEELDNLPTVDYSPNEMKDWDIIIQETKEQFNAGELIPMTAAEFAAEHGIKL